MKAQQNQDDLVYIWKQQQTRGALENQLPFVTLLHGRGMGQCSLPMADGFGVIEETEKCPYSHIVF